MDSNDLERSAASPSCPRTAPSTTKGTHINIVDTPGHADFGGEVERVLSMVDGVLLLVDAVEGPMPQTRFVTRKALALGLKPIVVVNKIDRPGARPDWVISHTFDLFDKLGATEEQLDFPVVFASALNGFAMLDATKPGTDMRPLYEAIIKHTCRSPTSMSTAAAATADLLARLQQLCRPHRHRPHQAGRMKAGQEVTVMYGDENKGKAKIGQIMMFTGPRARTGDEAEAGDIVLVTGIEQVGIGVTICDPAAPEAACRRWWSTSRR
jgi:GTP-binding protein